MRLRAFTTFQLFSVFGIHVFLHWSWFFAAAILVQIRVVKFGESGFDALLHILALFGIVLLHEFGHALACRSVGGQANTIVLWPLGGVAFVKPPPRPGAMLWSIAAGPLVNVALIPVTVVLLLVAETSPVDLQNWAASIFLGNLALLIFNMLPIYPLDGGQILQSLLWFVVGRSMSLKIVSVIGLVAAVVGGLLALRSGNLLLVVMAVFIASQAYRGYQVARMLAAAERFDFEEVARWQYRVSDR